MDLKVWPSRYARRARSQSDGYRAGECVLRLCVSLREKTARMAKDQTIESYVPARLDRLAVELVALAHRGFARRNVDLGWSGSHIGRSVGWSFDTSRDARIERRASRCERDVLSWRAQ